LEEALAAWTEQLNVKNGTTTDEAVKEMDITHWPSSLLDCFKFYTH